MEMLVRALVAVVASTLTALVANLFSATHYRLFLLLVALLVAVDLVLKTVVPAA